jgi:hypothetical protein
LLKKYHLLNRLLVINRRLFSLDFIHSFVSCCDGYAAAVLLSRSILGVEHRDNLFDLLLKYTVVIAFYFKH